MEMGSEFLYSIQTARAFGPGQNQLFWGLPAPLGQTSTFMPYTTQRIQAASAFQARPHYILYPGAVPTLSHLHHKCTRAHYQCPGSWQLEHISTNCCEDGSSTYKIPSMYHPRPLHKCALCHCV